jgi:hypothetical protein
VTSLEAQILKDSTRPRGRVYTGGMMTPTQRPPELEADQLAQAVCVGLCLALAAVLLVLAGVVRAAL